MKILLYILIFSQTAFLGVFWEWKKEYFVVEENSKLCWKFIPWDSEFPNWLPDTWRVLEKVDVDISTESYCRNKSYRYAGIPIWISKISLPRAWAEFLASKWIIEKRNLDPRLYNLEDTITRKEIMKIIIRIWDISVEDYQCLVEMKNFDQKTHLQKQKLWNWFLKQKI